MPMRADVKSSALLFIIALLTTPAKGALAAPERESVLVPFSIYEPFFKELGESPKAVPTLQVDTVPVTNKEFLSFTRSNPEWKRSQVRKLFADPGYLKHWTSDDSFPAKVADHPVVHVSWFAAREYCKHKGKRLLTIAEWERASDAENPEHLERIITWYGNPDPALGDVHRAPANRHGLKAMLGMIWEWNEDFSTVFLPGDAGSCGVNRKSPDVKDKMRYATFMRFAHRSSLNGAYTGANLGFRCAVTIDSEAATNTMITVPPQAAGRSLRKPLS